MAIEFSVPRPGQVNLGVFDVRGRRLRTLVDGTIASGHQRIVWDGRDESGVRQQPGLYFWKLKVDGHERTEKVTLLPADLPNSEGLRLGNQRPPLGGRWPVRPAIHIPTGAKDEGAC